MRVLSVLLQRCTRAAGVSRDVYVSLMGSRGRFATVHSKRGRSMCWSSTVCLVLRAHWVSIFAPVPRHDVAECKELAAPWRAPKNYAVRASTVATLRRIFFGNAPAARLAPDRPIDTARYRGRTRRSLGLPLSCRHRRLSKLIGLPFRPNLGHRCCFLSRAAGLNQQRRRKNAEVKNRYGYTKATRICGPSRDHKAQPALPE